MKRIDAHQHYWLYNKRDYGWISDEMVALRRNFLPDDLQEEICAAGIDRTIAVQARQSLEETEWLLKLAGEHDFIAGVIGWLPLAADNIDELLRKYTADPKLVGLRHVIQDEPDERFILGEAFNRGVRAMLKHRLTYDILIFDFHLPQAIKFVDGHPPEQIFVLDHIAKPKIRRGELEPWRSHIRELAARQNVFCKISGLVTEADLKNWQPDDFKIYLDEALAAFGSSRLIFGSDWPVCTAGVTYRDWVALIENYICKLSQDEQNNIMGLNARNAYRIWK